ncbi:MAG TPA: CmpA/NrtA family ABC transporter substrate-binding protein [Azospirillum sp.]|nr:CmpA/NrtA family ABC transporter substrate-binding protein [Azospirillum sp.]
MSGSADQRTGKGTRRSILAVGAMFAAGEELEKRALTLGFVPLTDCAPLVIAQEKGFFRRQGLGVTLSREPSWANIRDKVSVGVLDGAQMLAGMALAATAGVGAFDVPMVTACSLDLGGNAITVSENLWQRMAAADPDAMAERPLTARALKRVIEDDKAAGRPKLSFGIVFATASHNYQLRLWLASAGIDPDADVRLAVVPPPHMVAGLKDGALDGYCVGEPWNSQAVHEGLGRVLISAHELWNNGPEKVLGVTAAWAAAHPRTHRALVRALIQAARWLEEPGHRLEAAAILAGERYVGAPAEVLARALTGNLVYAAGEAPRAMPDFIVFHRYAATFPWRSHALWTLTQMVRWGQLPATADLEGIAAAVYRSDLYRLAARDLGEPVPLRDHKSEGAHEAPWLLATATAPIPMGPDLFFDRHVFEPDTEPVPAA